MIRSHKTTLNTLIDPNINKIEDNQTLSAVLLSKVSVTHGDQRYENIKWKIPEISNP